MCKHVFILTFQETTTQNLNSFEESENKFLKELIPELVSCIAVCFTSHVLFDFCKISEDYYSFKQKTLNWD